MQVVLPAPAADMDSPQVLPVLSDKEKYLAEIFTGKENPILRSGPLIVRNSSATRNAFRQKVLGSDDYNGCTVIAPDNGIVTTVSRDKSAIGHIDLSLVQGGTTVKSVSIK